MPFLIPEQDEFKTPRFYIFRGIAPQLGVSFIVQKQAELFSKQNKKVLIFDALLGLKNFPYPCKNQKKIPMVFNGFLPLTELITKEKNIDIIAGLSDQNLTSISLLQQQYIKESLMQLAQNYDVVLIDMPFHVINTIWTDMGENIWITSSDQNIIRQTLSANKSSQPHLILNLRENQSNLNQIYAFIKILCPDCQITCF